MTDRDALWATKIIAAFTPDDLRAIVRTGRFSDPEQEQYFYETLRTRQGKIVRRYLNKINPLGDFEVRDGHLAFTNLAEPWITAAGSQYLTRWMVYDNGADSYLTFDATTLWDPSPVSIPDIVLGVEHYLMAEITTAHPEHPSWNTPVEVYLRSTAGQLAVVGIERAAASSTVSTN